MHVKSENPLVAQCKFGAVINSELHSHTHQRARPFFKNQVRTNVLDRVAMCVNGDTFTSLTLSAVPG